MCCTRLDGLRPALRAALLTDRCSDPWERPSFSSRRQARAEDRNAGEMLHVSGLQSEDGRYQAPPVRLTAQPSSRNLFSCDTRRAECERLAHGEMRSPRLGGTPVSYTHLRAHETPEHLVCRLLLE